MSFGGGSYVRAAGHEFAYAPMKPRPARSTQRRLRAVSTSTPYGADTSITRSRSATRRKEPS